MNGKAFAVLGVVALMAVLPACTSNSTPASPTAAGNAAIPDASLKVTAPAVQSPVNDQRLAGLTATLTAGAATQQYAAVALQYRFQVFNDTGTLVQDSGLVGSPAWTTSAVLTPNKRFTWKVRAEYQGAAGPWSSAASFTTPDPPPAYAKPIGNWQACGGIVKDLDLSFCVWDTIRPGNLVDDMEVAKRIAWLRRGQGAGLFIKTSGEGIVLWQGYSFSASRICFSDGQLFKVIIDAGAGGANLPTYGDNGTIDPKLCVPAIDPSKP